MLLECLEALRIKSGGCYVDGTYGGGGHSKEILKKIPTGKLIAFDQDEDVLEEVPSDERFVFIQQNFRYMNRYLRLIELKSVDGIFLDLGISSHQIDEPKRGFSTRYSGPLDMRMSKQGVSAREVLNTLSESQLHQLFGELGEVRNAKTLAKAIVKERLFSEIETTEDLMQILKKVVVGNEHRYAAQVFQAIRIYVNDELGALKEVLRQSGEILSPGGRLVVLSYHSLEDRLVKNFMKKGNFEGEDIRDVYGNEHRIFKVITKKPIEASEEEKKENPRSRSAKLRIAEKL